MQKLTPREQQVEHLIFDECQSLNAVAYRLNIGRRRVARILASIKEKKGITNHYPLVTIFYVLLHF